MHHQPLRSPRDWTAFSLKLRVHIVDNLIPTLIGSVTAGKCLVILEPDERSERHALDEIILNQRKCTNRFCPVV